jgi:glutaredoxin
MWLLLKKWLGRAKPRRPDLHFVMYTRKDCHLCEAAWALLTKHQQERGFTLTAIDVDDSPEMVAKYGHEVPVIVVNGKERFHGDVNEVLLRRLLDAKSQRPQAAG